MGQEMELTQKAQRFYLHNKICCLTFTSQFVFCLTIWLYHLAFNQILSFSFYNTRVYSNPKCISG